MGPALQYFEPAILGEIVPKPIWLSDWDSFCAELEMNFGPFDNATQGEIKLEKIVMKEHYRVDVLNETADRKLGWILKSS